MDTIATTLDGGTISVGEVPIAELRGALYGEIAGDQGEPSRGRSV